MRRLPIYLLIDCSKSMAGEPMKAVNDGVRAILSVLRKDPCAVELAYLSVITFADDAKQTIPLTGLFSFKLPELVGGGAQSLGAALHKVVECVNREVVRNTREQRGDYKPLLFIMTDGAPTDDVGLGIQTFHTVLWTTVVAYVVGSGTDITVLQQITKNIATTNIEEEVQKGLRLLFWDDGSLVFCTKCGHAYSNYYLTQRGMHCRSHYVECQNAGCGYCHSCCDFKPLNDYFGVSKRPSLSSSSSESILVSNPAAQSSFTDIFKAAAKGTVEDVRYFVENGVRVTTTDRNGWTALHHAALNHYPEGMGHLGSKAANGYALEILEYLVSQGCDINAKTNPGWTALHLAATDNPRRRVLKCLIRLGADIKAKNSGKTALDLTRDVKKKEILRQAMTIAEPQVKIPSDVAERLGLSTNGTEANCSDVTTDNDLDYLSRLTQLQTLNLYGCENITDAELVYLKGLTQLKTLNLGRCENFTDAGLTYLKDLMQMQTLDLANTNITDAGLVYLKDLMQLENLNLSGTNVTDAGLVHLKGLRQLKRLDIMLCENMTGVGLVYLKNLMQLENLDLWRSNITDSGLVHLKDLTHLRELNLNGCMNITNVGLVYLEDLTHLETLDLSGLNITDVGLVHLRVLTRLQTLNLANTNITDSGLARLKSLTQLENLDLSRTDITDSGLVHLKDLTQLRTLDIKRCKNITDAGLVHLKGLTQLQTLDIRFCGNITDAGLVHLKSLTHLHTLDIRFCENITDDGINELNRDLYFVRSIS